MAGGLKEYFVLDGEMIGQQLSPGGSRVDFMTDAQGSVTGTVGSNGAVQKTYRFTPYGLFLSETGTGPDPDFRWNGANQYYDTLLPHAEYYVRARNSSSTEGRWTTVDPLWPQQLAYGYVGGRVVLLIDPSGALCQAVAIYPIEVKIINNSSPVAGASVPTYAVDLQTYVKWECVVTCCPSWPPLVGIAQWKTGTLSVGHGGTSFPMWTPDTTPCDTCDKPSCVSGDCPSGPGFSVWHVHGMDAPGFADLKKVNCLGCELQTGPENFVQSETPILSQMSFETWCSVPPPNAGATGPFAPNGQVSFAWSALAAATWQQMVTNTATVEYFGY